MTVVGVLVIIFFCIIALLSIISTVQSVSETVVKVKDKIHNKLENNPSYAKQKIKKELSSLTWPEPVVAINVGMKAAISLTIREINSLIEELNLRNPYLMVGKGHIRICADGEDNPPFTLKINSFRESKQYGVKTYRWTIFN